MFKVLLFGTMCFVIINGDAKDKPLERLEQDNEVKVDEAVNAKATSQDKTAETMKTDKKSTKNIKSTTNKKLDETKNVDKEREKKVNEDAVVEKPNQSDEFVNKVYGIFNDVKDSFMETVEIVSKYTADVAEQARIKFDELSAGIQKSNEQTKTDKKATSDL